MNDLTTLYGNITSEIGKAVVGQQAVKDEMFCAMVAGGHVLLEGVPGIAKTLLVRCLAGSIGADFGRIQFTPDLMPSDVTGTNIYDGATGSFHFARARYLPIYFWRTK